MQSSNDTLQVHINSTTMDAVATQSINDVFSSTFRNYLIIGELALSISTTNLTMRLRASGSDNLTSNYSHGTISSIQASTVTSSITANGTSWRLTDNVGVGNRGFNLQIYNPNIARATVLNGTIAANRFPHINSCIFQPTTSFDGFTLIPGAGTLTGQINIYGLKD